MVGQLTGAPVRRCSSAPVLQCAGASVKNRKSAKRPGRKQLFELAKRYIPGGVNSPVRSFAGVGGEPVFVQRAAGAKFYSACDREFIDYCLCWGALILGHARPAVVQGLRLALKQGTGFGTTTELEIELAGLIVGAIASVEQVRLTNSGTEAVMSAVRVARAYTRKNKIIKFAGCYHGHADYLLVASGSGSATLGIPNSAGVPPDFVRHTVVAPFNDIDAVAQAVRKYQKDLAAIIVEPVAANCGVILPKAGFLAGLRRLADKFGLLLIFDEVITGFRLALGGAQEFFNIDADLTCLGKIIGGGLPVGAFGGRKEIMRLLAPAGRVYQAGTLSGNPLAVTAGIATLRSLKAENPYPRLARNTQRLCQGIKEQADEFKVQLKINCIGSLFSIFFAKNAVGDYAAAQKQNRNLFRSFFHYLLNRGVYFSPSGFEANFLSTAHTAGDIRKTLKLTEEALKKISALK